MEALFQMAVYNISGVKVPAKPVVFELDIVDPPQPLVLLINPESLDFGFTSKVSSSRTRLRNSETNPYILQHHHDELDTLSASGMSALFYSNKGLTTNERTKTLGYENIQKLISIYRNNGLNYDRRAGRISSLIKSVGSVLLTYDGSIFQGSFISLNITEDEQSPFNLSFSF